jgi:hypothetical protein
VLARVTAIGTHAQQRHRPLVPLPPAAMDLRAAATRGTDHDKKVYRSFFGR